MAVRVARQHVQHVHSTDAGCVAHGESYREQGIVALDSASMELNGMPSNGSGIREATQRLHLLKSAAQVVQ